MAQKAYLEILLTRNFKLADEVFVKDLPIS